MSERYTDRELGLMVDLLEYLVIASGGEIKISMEDAEKIACRENTLRIFRMENPPGFRVDLKRFVDREEQPALPQIFDGEIVEDEPQQKGRKAGEFVVFNHPELGMVHGELLEPRAGRPGWWHIRLHRQTTKPGNYGQFYGEGGILLLEVPDA